MPSIQEEWNKATPVTDIQSEWDKAKPTTPESDIPKLSSMENMIASAIGGVKDIVTDPKRLGRLVTQGLGATAGGIIGAPAGGIGAFGGGTLGFAFGDQLADIIWGERLPPKEAGKVWPQVKQTAEDIVEGAKFEALGGAMNITGKGLYAAEKSITSGLKSMYEKGILKAPKEGIGKWLEKKAETLTAKRISEATTKGQNAVTEQIEKNIVKTEEIEKAIPGLKFNLGQKGSDPNLLSLARQQGQMGGEGTRWSNESLLAQNEALTKYIDTHIRRNGDISDFLSQVGDIQQKLAGGTVQAMRTTEIEAVKLIGRSQQEVGETLLKKAKVFRKTDSATAERLYNDVPGDTIIDVKPLWDRVEQLFGGFDALTQRLGTTPTGMMGRVKQAMKPEETFAEGLKETAFFNPAKILDAKGKEILATERALPSQLTMKQIRDFRSQVSTAQRYAVAKQDYELAYNLGQLKDGVNETLSSAAEKGTGKGIEELRKATAFWRDTYVPKYRYGATGKILGVQKTGEQKVSDSLIGSQYFKSGPEAADAADSFLMTFGKDTEAKSLIKDYASQSLLRSSRNPITGELESGRTLKWMYSHNTALEKLGLKNDFGTVQKSIQLTDRAKVMEVEFNKSSLAKALSVDPDRAIREMLMVGLGKKQSITRMKNMVALARADKTGAAIEGLRAGIGDYFQNETVITARDIAGRKLESLAKMDKLMKEFMPAFRESGLYTVPELEAFGNVHKAIQTIAQQQRPHPAFAGSPTFELLSRSAGAGASIALGRFGIYGVAKKGFELLEAPLKENINTALAKAIFDPRYAEAISGLAADLGKTSTQKAMERFSRRVATLGMIIYSNAPKSSEIKITGEEAFPSVGP